MKNYTLVKIFDARNYSPKVWSYLCNWWNGQQRYMSWIVDIDRKNDIVSKVLIENGAKNGEFVLLNMD